MAVTLFINYAEEDSRYWKELDNHLSMLKRKGTIAHYSSDKIIPGQVRTDEMQKQLHSADIVLLLVSSDLIARDETYDLMEMAFRVNKLVLPILVRKCPWKDIDDLAKLSVLPSNEIPIAKWEDADEAYTHIIQELKKVIDQTKQPKTHATSTSPTTIEPLLLNKKYTCNRIQQREAFDEHLEDYKKTKKVLFYVIQGEEIQSPYGLHQCLRDRDLLRALKIDYVKTFEEEITVEPNSKLARSKSKLLGALCDIWQMDMPDLKPEQTTLLDLLDAPAIKGNRIISTCLYIDTQEWNDNIPLVAEWFVNRFCKVQLPEHAPQFVFFIVLDYESNQQYKEFIQYFAPLQQRQSFCLLPLLEPVKRKDINLWLKKAGMRDVERREELLQKQLQEKGVHNEPEIDMQKVEKILHEIITQNNRELDTLANL
jgi:hypothetical protein